MPFECPQCGMLLEQATVARCPKCETAIRKTFQLGLYEIDVAHRGETWEVAERRVIEACSTALYRQHKGLKVIHGYGSGKGHTSMIRRLAVPLLHRLARDTGGKVVPDRNNPGAHILYFH